jgi:hypothetical protein
MRRAPPQPDPASPCRSQAGVDSLPDDLALEFGDGHKDPKLKSANRVTVGSVDSLA